MNDKECIHEFEEQPFEKGRDINNTPKKSICKKCNRVSLEFEGSNLSGTIYLDNNVTLTIPPAMINGGKVIFIHNNGGELTPNLQTIQWSNSCEELIEPKIDKEYICIKEYTHWGGIKYELGQVISYMNYVMTEAKDHFVELKRIEPKILSAHSGLLDMDVLTIEEEAEKQWKNVHRTGVLAFIDGAKSESSKQYWYKEFIKQQKHE